MTDDPMIPFECGYCGISTELSDLTAFYEGAAYHPGCLAKAVGEVRVYRGTPEEIVNQAEAEWDD